MQYLVASHETLFDPKLGFCRESWWEEVYNSVATLQKHIGTLCSPIDQQHLNAFVVQDRIKPEARVIYNELKWSVRSETPKIDHTASSLNSTPKHILHLTYPAGKSQEQIQRQVTLYQYQGWTDDLSEKCCEDDPLSIGLALVSHPMMVNITLSKAEQALWQQRVWRFLAFAIEEHNFLARQGALLERIILYIKLFSELHGANRLCEGQTTINVLTRLVDYMLHIRPRGRQYRWSNLCGKILTNCPEGNIFDHLVWNSKVLLILLKSGYLKFLLKIKRVGLKNCISEWHGYHCTMTQLLLSLVADGSFGYGNEDLSEFSEQIQAYVVLELLDATSKKCFYCLSDPGNPPIGIKSDLYFVRSAWTELAHRLRKSPAETIFQSDRALAKMQSDADYWIQFLPGLISIYNTHGISKDIQASLMAVFVNLSLRSEYTALDLCRFGLAQTAIDAIVQSHHHDLTRVSCVLIANLSAQKQTAILTQNLLASGGAICNLLRVIDRSSDSEPPYMPCCILEQAVTALSNFCNAYNARNENAKYKDSMRAEKKQDRSLFHYTVLWGLDVMREHNITESAPHTLICKYKCIKSIPRLLHILCLDMLSRREGDDLSGERHTPSSNDVVGLCKATCDLLLNLAFKASKMIKIQMGSLLVKPLLLLLKHQDGTGYFQFQRVAVPQRRQVAVRPDMNLICGYVILIGQNLYSFNKIL